jgi:hypothetical protein
MKMGYLEFGEVRNCDRGPRRRGIKKLMFFSRLWILLAEMKTSRARVAIPLICIYIVYMSIFTL